MSLGNPRTEANSNACFNSLNGRELDRPLRVEPCRLEARIFSFDELLCLVERSRSARSKRSPLEFIWK
jgi:hypothetical protein